MNRDASTSEYRAIGILAKGGMGQVELAVRVRANFQRLYALKRLRAEHRSNDEFRLMFLDEGRVAGLLRHPNVVSVLDVGTDEMGPYLVMELVEGLDCSAFIKAHHELGQPVPEQVALRIIRDIALGLNAAHEQLGLEGETLNLVHRDVSPQNILIDFDGIAKVTDFGIAKSFGRLSETTTGLLKGKAGYMSPEQLRFEEVDGRSDLFSLGVVLYELLAGTRLYRRDTTTAIARAILTEPPPDIMSVRPGTKPAVCELLFELLAKQPEHRPSSGAEVADRVGALLEELVQDEGEMSLRDYMNSSFAAERSAGSARQKALLLDADISSAPVLPGGRHLRKWRGRNLILAGLALLASGVALGTWAWPRVSDSGATDSSAVGTQHDQQPTAPSPTGRVSPVHSAAPAMPVAVPASRAQNATPAQQPSHEGRSRSARGTRHGHRTGAEMSAEMSSEMSSEMSIPSSSNEVEARPQTERATQPDEPGTRARSHAVAF